MKRIAFLPLIAAMAISCGHNAKPAGDLKINDLEYFENQGVNVLVYSNLFTGGFNDEKNSGIEIIHHGVRTVQGGAVRLCNTPEQWDLVPETPTRTVNKDGNSIEVSLRYEDYDFDSRVVVTGKGKAVEIAVYLDKPLPAELVGNAGFNLEFLPAHYWNKSYIVDGKPDRFPRYTVGESVARPNEEKMKQFKGFRTYDDRGTGEFVDPLPLAVGHEFLMAPEDPVETIKISSDSELNLYDGRIIAQNGWYVLRSLLPAGQTGKVLSWTVEPKAIDGWVREPNVGFSQVGYLPAQPKVAVIELDKVDKVLPKASVIKVCNDGSEKTAYSGAVKEWGRFYKYNYARFDFSSVSEPGIYYLKYGDVKTNNFIIGEDVYDKITDATTDIWVPIHMNHMTVNEAYRIWHGEPFKEGYLQAPANQDHFDLHSTGPSIDTKYKPLELIPGLNVGGYFDAGDFDIETSSNINVIQSLCTIWEQFRPMRDMTFVDEDQRYVDIHRPDGKPDLLQYIEHGTLNIVAQAENIGHMSQCLSNSVLDNYHHLGDASTLTDGLHYDPRLKPYQKSADGKSSGTPDDMWAFTTRNPSLDINAANVLAAASHALKGYNDELAARALKQSKRLMEEGSALLEQQMKNRPMPKPVLEGEFIGGAEGEHHVGQGGQQGAPQGAPQGGGNRRMNFGDVATNLQLYIATGEQSYIDKFNESIWNMLDNERGLNMGISTALQAVPYMDEAFKEKLRPYMVKYKEYLDGLDEDNPYGVPIGLGGWAGSGSVVSFGSNAAFASLYFPDIIDKSYAYKAAAFLFGCHMYHNYSLVATVGATRPKNLFYGNNRADFSFIPGNVAPGLLFRHPDHFENYDEWPFLWGQNEGTIAGNCSYINFSSVLRMLPKE